MSANISKSIHCFLIYSFFFYLGLNATHIHIEIYIHTLWEWHKQRKKAIQNDNGVKVVQLEEGYSNTNKLI